MVEKLSGNKTVAQKSGTRAKELVAKLTVDFEKNMNNDLHVKDAFDELVNTVSKLATFKEKHELSVEDSNEAIAKLKAIDEVLRVIF